MEDEILLDIIIDNGCEKVLDKFIKGKELTTRACDILIKIIEATELINCPGNSLTTSFQELFLVCVFRLEKIIGIDNLKSDILFNPGKNSSTVLAAKNDTPLTLDCAEDSSCTFPPHTEKLSSSHEDRTQNFNSTLNESKMAQKESSTLDEFGFIRKLTLLTVLLYQKLECREIKIDPENSLQKPSQNSLQNQVNQKLKENRMLQLKDESLRSTCISNAMLLKNIIMNIEFTFALQTNFGQVIQKHDRIKILALTYSTLCEGSGLILNEYLKHQLKSVVIKSLSIMKKCEDNDLIALLLSLIVRPYLEASSESRVEIIQKLWQVMVKFYSIRKDSGEENGLLDEVENKLSYEENKLCFKIEKNKLGFMVLCFMAEYMFEEGIFDNIGSSRTFWQIIQFGLIHSDSLSRKRSQYVLKRCVDFYTSNQPSEQHISDYLPWPEDEREEIIKLWNTFFLLIETLEEKQAHVLKPILEKLKKLITASCHSSKPIFHPTWLLVVFKRLFDHDNKNMKQRGLAIFLEEKWPAKVLTEFLPFTTSHLLLALSDYSLYLQDPDKKTEGAASMGDKFALYISNSVTSLQSEVTVGSENGVSQQSTGIFMSSLLEAIFNGQPWGGIPLFYITRALSMAPNVVSWKYEMVKQAVINFEHCLSTQEVVLRSASQCDLIRAILTHLIPDTTFLQFCDILGRFRRKESWCRGTVIWDTIITTLGNHFGTWNEKQESLQNVITESLSSNDLYSPNDIALGICLLMDSQDKISQQENKKEIIKSLLQPFSSFLKDCHIRPYLDFKKLSWVLEILTQVVEILQDVPRVSEIIDGEANKPHCCMNDTEHEDIFTCLTEGIECVVQLFMQQISNYKEPLDIDTVLLHLNFYSQCYSLTPLKSILFRHYPEILLKCKALLQDGPAQDTLTQVFGILLLEHLLENFQNQPKDFTKELVCICFENVIKKIEILSQRRQLEGYESSEYTREVVLEGTRSCWHCVQTLVDKNTSWEEYMGDGMAKEVRKLIGDVLIGAIPTASRRNILHVFNVAVSLSSYIIKSGIWEDVVRGMWAACEDLRKSCDLHRSLVSCLSCLLYHPDALLSDRHHGFMIQMSEQMLAAAECIQGISTHMSRQLSISLAEVHRKGHLHPASLCDIVQFVLVPLLMYGSVYQKQYRVIRHTVMFIRACGKHYSTNTLLDSDWDSEIKTRALITRYLLTLSKSDENQCLMAGVVVEAIQQHYNGSGAERRDFANSQNHRYKTRLLQALMILLPLLDLSESEVVLSWLGRGIICEHQQPSVRYLQEWGTSLITILHPQLYPSLLQHFKEGTKKRLGCVGSFLASLTHVACCSRDPKLLCQAIQHTLPWCMAQHFNTRLYAQVSLRKIWKHCEAMNIEEVMEKYYAVAQCLQFIEEHGNAARNTTNMLNDFYFKVFHPIDHFTLQTLFYDLPCLSLIASEEWISVQYLLDASDLPITSTIPLYNQDTVLASSPPAPWVIKAAGETPPYEEEEDNTQEPSNVQRKITPWKSMVPEITSGLGLPQETQQTKAQQKRNGLILIASLIDKAANLGGLCRTCEVFRVQQLVVDTLVVKQDHTFTALSLTAHNWLPMKEVKVDGLGRYLRWLRAEGYTLVGAEQTANSTSLSHYQFPEKSVVLLGNEREGIPCELLQLLDVCVEIPQWGVIRSLNVHVSGALFVWEYSRQHSLTTPP